VRWIADLLMWGVVAFSLLSAADYFHKFWRKIDDRVKRRRRRELLALEKRRRKLGAVAAVRAHPE
jgi:hypothetical protein